jgi:phosphatidylethanolamine-binding protein (PEBP) family uncharacterized protein
MNNKFVRKYILTHHADESLSVWHNLSKDVKGTLKVESPDFKDNKYLPKSAVQKMIGGENKSPSFEISNIPKAAKYLVMIMEDLDVPLKRPGIHSVAYTSHNEFDGDDNASIKLPSMDLWDAITADHKRKGYVGPMPPNGHGPHRYEFQFYAIDPSIIPNNVSMIGISEKYIRDVLKFIHYGVISAGKITGIWEEGEKIIYIDGKPVKESQAKLQADTKPEEKPNSKFEEKPEEKPESKTDTKAESSSQKEEEKSSETAVNSD